MASQAQETSESNARHKRTPSNVLKSIVATRSQNTKPSKSQSPTKVDAHRSSTRTTSKGLSAISTQSRTLSPPLGEIHNNRDRVRSPPQRSIGVCDEGKDKSKMLHKRNKSAVSLKSLGRKTSQKSSKSKAVDADEKNAEPIKSKSSTNIAAIFSKSKSSKSREKGVDEVRNKENETPIRSAEGAPPPPIWAQFTTPQTQEIKTTKIPLNDQWNIEDEAALYTPQDYSPSKGRNFFEQPALAGKDLPRPRPISSMATPSPSSNSLIDTFTKLRKSSTSTSSAPAEHKPRREHDKGHKSKQEESKHTKVPTSSAGQGNGDESSKPGLTITKRGSRVMAAVAVLNGKSRDVATASKDAVANPANIESAFEKMLVSNGNHD